MNKKYHGMTVNERLYVSGLMNEFEKAVKNKDIASVVKFLGEIDILDGSATHEILLQLGLIENN